MSRRAPRLLFVVNADWFFLSHRLPLARACIAAGYEVGLCSGESGHRASLEREGIRCFSLPIDRGGTHPLRDARTCLSLLQTYRSFRPDLVHHVTIKPVLYGSLAARAAGVRSVVNAVSGLGYAFIPRERERPFNVALRTALRGAYRLALSGAATRVIFQNDDDRSAFIRLGLVSENRTCLIRGSGVDLEHFRPAPLPDGAPLALVPSRLLWDKGIGEFVAAATAVRTRHPRARFVLLGRIDPGNPAAISEGQVRTWVEQGLIEWWPACSHQEMPAKYHQAHVVVLPSYREGLPLALAEAAACGRAVITTDVPGCRDTVSDRTGWLVPARDSHGLTTALEQAFTERADLLARGAAARQFAQERFDVRRVVEQTLGTYTELLRGNLN
jgi:glycosyltransferase involved in cell wall biosynthesis